MTRHSGLHTPTAAELEGHLRMVVCEAFPELGDAVTEGATETLPGFSDFDLGLRVGPALDFATLATSICADLEAVQAGTLTPARGLAQIALQVSRAVHRQLCTPPRGNARRRALRACERDVRVAADLVATSANPYCGVDLDKSLAPIARGALEASALGDVDVVAAIEAAIEPILHPRWDSRRPLPVVATRPIVQVNSAITLMPQGTYDWTRILALRIRELIEGQGWVPEVTSDYAAPGSLRHVLPDEGMTRRGIYRASAIVLFTEFGGHGTFTTWNLANELLVPLLVLERRGKQVQSQRFPGHLFRQTVEVYEDAPEALAAVERFLSDQRGAILKRSHQLAGYAAADARGSEVLSGLDVAAFDGSPATLELARFALTDAVVWRQIRPALREEILRVLGLGDSAQSVAPAFPAARPGIARKDLVHAESFRSLLRVAEVDGWSSARMEELVDAHARVIERQVSPKDGPWRAEDWRQLNDRVPRREV